MELTYKKLGEGFPLIILHGLYGMSDNWLSIGKELSEKFEVFLVDLRNHGDSPHADTMSYPEMAKDLFVFFHHHFIEKAVVLGHSMGGKTAMCFSFLYPGLVEKLIVVDISPKPAGDITNNSPHLFFHRKIIKSLSGLDLTKFNNRTDILNEIEKGSGSNIIAQFLMKNVKRNKDNSFSWKFNLDAISKSLPNILDGLEKSQIKDLQSFNSIRSLFVRGEKSDYIPESDFDYIKELFPLSQIETAENAGHWVHAEQPKTFLNMVNEFLG